MCVSVYGCEGCEVCVVETLTQVQISVTKNLHNILTLAPQYTHNYTVTLTFELCTLHPDLDGLLVLLDLVLLCGFLAELGQEVVQYCYGFCLIGAVQQRSFDELENHQSHLEQNLSREEGAM